MKKLLHSKKFIAISLILASIIFEFTSSCLYILFTKTDAASFPEILYYFCQIISSIFVTSGVIIAVWQYYLSSKSEKNNLEVIQVQRAIDLSEYYKDNILKYYPGIRYVFDSTKIMDILDTVKISQLQDFDIHELNRLFTPQQIQSLRSIQQSDRFCTAVLQANEIYGLNLDIRRTQSITFSSGGKKEITVTFDKQLIIAFLGNLINDLLNNMEFFALHFKHNTADESVVYQSLHKTYLEIVKAMYYYIANANSDPTSKLYTNVTWLFDVWRTKKEVQTAERSAKSKLIESHGTIIGND